MPREGIILIWYYSTLSIDSHYFTLVSYNVSYSLAQGRRNELFSGLQITDTQIKLGIYSNLIGNYFAKPPVIIKNPENNTSNV